MKVDQRAGGVGAWSDRPFARDSVEINRLELDVARDRPDGANLLDPASAFFPAHWPRLAAQESANGVDFAFSHGEPPCLPRPFYVGVRSIGQCAEVARGLEGVISLDVTRYVQYISTVIVGFADAKTERFFREGVCPARWHSISKAIARKLDMLDAAPTLATLRSPPGNRLEALKGDRAGEYSIRVNQQWRVCFVWTETGPDRVEIVDYH